MPQLNKCDLKTRDEIWNFGAAIFICGQIEILFYANTIEINCKHCKLHTITLSHRQNPAVWCSFIFFFQTKNRAFIKTDSVSQAVECLPNQQGSEKTGLEPAAAACDGLSEAARPRSQPPLSGTFLGQGQEWRGIEGLIQPRLLNVYFIAWFFGHRKIYTSDFVVLHVDQLILWDKFATHVAFVLS